MTWIWCQLQSIFQGSCYRLQANLLLKVAKRRDVTVWWCHYVMMYNYVLTWNTHSHYQNWPSWWKLRTCNVLVYICLFVVYHIFIYLHLIFYFICKGNITTTQFVWSDIFFVFNVIILYIHYIFVLFIFFLLYLKPVAKPHCHGQL